MSGKVPSQEEQELMVEAILFASATPVTVEQLRDRLPVGCDPREVLARLTQRYQGRGVVLERSGKGWSLRTNPDYAYLLQETKEEKRKLSRAALETLAIIAYRQPVTRLEIEETRGVAVARGTLDRLMDNGWVAFGCRRQTPGRPLTFVTTDAFLDFFDLRDLADLPGLQEIRDSGLLDNRDAGVPANLSGNEQELEEEALDNSPMIEEFDYK